MRTQPDPVERCRLMLGIAQPRLAVWAKLETLFPDCFVGAVQWFITNGISFGNATRPLELRGNITGTRPVQKVSNMRAMTPKTF
jgi:hypothetical protein